jgi:hypothetical protein
MEYVDIAGRRLRIGLAVREVGEPVPEAKYFKSRNRKAMLNTGHLKQIPADELSEAQKEKLVQYSANLQPKHVGGGMYELPDGRKIRGKEAAEQAMMGEEA